jgi:hypothetical protein
LALPIPTFQHTQFACKNFESLRDIRFWADDLLNDLNDWPTIDSLNARAQRLFPHFSWTFVLSEKVPSRAKSRGSASLTGYVELISRHKKIPVRERNLHDFLNAISFLMFPASKLALNDRHLLESPNGVKPGQNRTKVQDLLTMFDEGGVIRLHGPNGLYRDLIFGHAVNEHIVLEKTIRAARLDFTVDVDILTTTLPNLIAIADDLFANWLKNETHCQNGGEFSHVWIPEK